MTLEPKPVLRSYIAAAYDLCNELTDSVWARIGLVPTKVDLEKSSRDFVKTIHAAAKAIRDAMNFAPNLAGLEKAEKSAKTAKTATTETAEMPEPASEKKAA